MSGSGRRGWRALVPPPLRGRLGAAVTRVIRWIKAPRMVWGWRDADGAWRPRTRVSDTVFFYHPERVRLADDVFIWHYTIIDGTGGVEIGQGSQIGAWVGVFTHSSHLAIRLYGHHYSQVPETEKVGYPTEPVRIGRFVFVGAGSKILPGVTIGDGALVAAGSVVSRSVPAGAVVAGNPAKVIGDTRKLDEQYLAADPQLRAWYEEWQGPRAPANDSTAAAAAAATD